MTLKNSPREKPICPMIMFDPVTTLSFVNAIFPWCCPSSNLFADGSERERITYQCVLMSFSHRYQDETVADDVVYIEESVGSLVGDDENDQRWSLYTPANEEVSLKKFMGWLSTIPPVASEAGYHQRLLRLLALIGMRPKLIVGKCKYLCLCRRKVIDCDETKIHCAKMLMYEEGDRL